MDALVNEHCKEARFTHSATTGEALEAAPNLLHGHSELCNFPPILAEAGHGVVATDGAKVLSAFEWNILLLVPLCMITLAT